MKSYPVVYFVRKVRVVSQGETNLVGIDRRCADRLVSWMRIVVPVAEVVDDPPDGWSTSNRRQPSCDAISKDDSGVRFHSQPFLDQAPGDLGNVFSGTFASSFEFLEAPFAYPQR
jgi:hypothetical protein